MSGTRRYGMETNMAQRVVFLVVACTLLQRTSSKIRHDRNTIDEIDVLFPIQYKAIRYELMSLPMERLLKVRSPCDRRTRREVSETNARSLLVQIRAALSSRVENIGKGMSITQRRKLLEYPPKFADAFFGRMSNMPDARQEMNGVVVPVGDDGVPTRDGYGESTPSCEALLNRWIGCSQVDMTDETLDEKTNKMRKKVWNSESPNVAFSASYENNNEILDFVPSLRKDRRVPALVPSSIIQPRHPAEVGSEITKR